MGSTLPPVYLRLLKMCRRRGFSREDAKEFVQEAYLRLLQYRQSTEVKDANSLLRRIALNISINRFHRDESTPFTLDSIDALERHSRLVDGKPGPEREVAGEQQLSDLANVLSAVSPRTCQIFIAQRSGYSYEEIAAAFAVKPRTVEKHVAAAAALLTEHGCEPPAK